MNLLNLIGYVGGLVAHVLFKCFNWMAAKKGNRFGNYWGEYAGLNGASAVAAIFFYPLWEMGWIAGALSSIYVSALGAIGVTGTATRELTVTPLTSAMAGFLLDSVARTLVLTFQKLIERRARKRLLDIPPTGDGGDQ